MEGATTPNDHYSPTVGAARESDYLYIVGLRPGAVFQLDADLLQGGGEIIGAL